MIALLEARICVNFNEPGSQLTINHEVIAKDLQAELPIVLVDLLTHTHHCRLDYREYVVLQKLVEVDLEVVLLFEVLGSLFKREYIAFLEFTVVLSMLLDRIVSEMHE